MNLKPFIPSPVFAAYLLSVGLAFVGFAMIGTQAFERDNPLALGVIMFIMGGLCAVVSLTVLKRAERVNA